jgi:selenocysteine lyase/cysteine desulfurase
MLESYFSKFRNEVIGNDSVFHSPYGEKRIVYADWTASGRLYRPIEKRLVEKIGPFVGNTHTGTTVSGRRMTEAYHYALRFIKKHVNAGAGDVIISSNSGMTGVVNKFQRILGLKIHEKYQKSIKFKTNERPLILVTHMEHHSNQTSWIETLGDVVVIPSDSKGLVDLEALHKLLRRYKKRKVKIAAVTSFSNVTGVASPYYEIAEIMHEHGGLCFVDFAASAPYINIDMHPENEAQKLDAIFFSPHKFLGGPGGTGILIFDNALYKNKVPDCPGGGTVEWTNPWGGHQYVDDIEQREDGGTPAFLQTIKVALAIQLKEEMGVNNMLKREKELNEIIWKRLSDIPNLHLLASNIKDRLGIYSFYIDEAHYNFIVKYLNDKYGIQTRGGCSCAGTYGHFLLEVDVDTSKIITNQISHGDLSMKPGWIRMSIHPIMSDEEINYILEAIEDVAKNHKEYVKEYKYDSHTNEFFHASEQGTDVTPEQWITSKLQD